MQTLHTELLSLRVLRLEQGTLGTRPTKQQGQKETHAFSRGGVAAFHEDQAKPVKAGSERFQTGQSDRAQHNHRKYRAGTHINTGSHKHRNVNPDGAHVSSPEEEDSLQIVGTGQLKFLTGSRSAIIGTISTGTFRSRSEQE